jgi:hypothetical protein
MVALNANIAYASRCISRPRYYANDHNRDILEIDPQLMPIMDARGICSAVDVEGFALIPHVSAVRDFNDAAAVLEIHRAEITELVKSISGADAVQVNAPGILRFSEKSRRAGSLNNSMPARFAHIDITDGTAAGFAKASAPADRLIRRHAHFNVWRAISAPPQDVPLAVCDARSVEPNDLIIADAVFDEPGKPEWSFEGWVVAHNPAHRWHWFSNLTRDEALVFKTNDSDPAFARYVPHVAFDHPTCPADAPARASIEMRAIAYWYG